MRKSSASSSASRRTSRRRRAAAARRAQADRAPRTSGGRRRAARARTGPGAWRAKPAPSASRSVSSDAHRPARRACGRRMAAAAFSTAFARPDPGWCSRPTSPAPSRARRPARWCRPRTRLARPVGLAASSGGERVRHQSASAACRSSMIRSIAPCALRAHHPRRRLFRQARGVQRAAPPRGGRRRTSSRTSSPARPRRPATAARATRTPASARW
jgi:hypothetical protein